LADIFKLDNTQLDYMMANSSRYYTGLLALFELWAKPFVEKSSSKSVNGLMKGNLSYA